MGARGPVPKATSVTRHQSKQRRRNLEAATPTVPELPDGYSDETRAWWESWLASPQTSFFAATDWQTLLRCAKLVDLFNAKPTAQLAAEIRQIESKLGGTAADRDRLGWKIDPPAEDAQPAPAGARSRPDPRRHAT